ncbi:MAG TPA: hypothetical protein VF981_05670 [Gemmatimonadaceae bacterium]|jgi:hypothetical protein
MLRARNAGMRATLAEARFARLVAFLQGAREGLLTPMDESDRFVPRSPAALQPAPVSGNVARRAADL